MRFPVLVVVMMKIPVFFLCNDVWSGRDSGKRIPDSTASHQRRQVSSPCMYVCMYKGWAFTALAPRPTVVYCA
jgi:hypothetical protein